MIVLTNRALILLAAISLVGLLGFLSPVGLDLMIGLDTLVVLLVFLDSRLAVPPGRLTVTREAPESCSIGRSVTYQYHWTNPRPRPAYLTVREVRPALLGGVQSARPLTVPADGRLRETLQALPNHRGREVGGWLAVRSRGPLGLSLRQGKIDLPWTVTVYPSLPASRLKASIAEAVRRRDPGLRQARRLGEGRQFESLRTWVPGDDTRHIDWKATARRGRLIARQFEAERRQQVLLVIDAGRLLTAEVAGEARMEHVVRAALWVAFAANHHDDNVGVMVFADEILQYAPPRRGRRGLRQVLDVLAVVEPRFVEPDYPRAFQYLSIRNRKRALTILFTDVIDRLASEALVSRVASLRPRHLPLVVTLRNPDLDSVADARPTTVGEAYRKAAAEELLAARGEALAGMRQAGAIVLDVNPARASAAVVEKYIELKRHGRL